MDSSREEMSALQSTPQERSPNVIMTKSRTGTAMKPLERLQLEMGDVV